MSIEDRVVDLENRVRALEKEVFHTEPEEPTGPVIDHLLSTWAEGTEKDNDGATRDYYNAAADLLWEQRLGDWTDVQGQLHGEMPFSTAEWKSEVSSPSVMIDVLPLVKAWLVAPPQSNQGVMLQVLQGKGITLHSRHQPETLVPRMLVTSNDGPIALKLIGDVHLRKGTFKGSGDAMSLELSQKSPVLLKFDVSTLPKLPTDILSAELEFTFPSNENFDLTVGAFMPYVPILVFPEKREFFVEPIRVKPLFEEKFESDDWSSRWSAAPQIEHTKVYKNGVLFITFPKGSHAGADFRFVFQDKLGYEPEEMYFRYYLMVGEDFSPTDSGKLPGFTGTYGSAGWGGRRSNGVNGWSARGHFNPFPSLLNPLKNRLPIGSYIYHADMVSAYGDGPKWNECSAGFLTRGTWHCIEQRLKLNTPGLNDGILQAWVDGYPVYDQQNWRWRDVDELKIERVWMNFYHGGKKVLDSDGHMYVRDVVINSEYIGPSR